MASVERRARWLVAGGLMLASVAVLVPGSLHANEYPLQDGDYHVFPDNSEHTYCWGEDFSSDSKRDAANYAAQNLADQTTMIRNKVPSCTGLTDVIWAGGRLPGGFYGRSYCLEANRVGLSNNFKCQQWRIRMDERKIHNHNQWRHGSCHELGHTVGLRHHDKCMRKVKQPGDDNWVVYSDHDWHHINQDRNP